MKVDKRQKMLIPCLPYKMKAAGATFHSLSRASGLDVKTIWQVCQGGSCLLSNGLALMGALNSRNFRKEKKKVAKKK